MRKKASDWEELEDLTIRLDELRSQLDAAENGNKIAMIYALEEAIDNTWRATGPSGDLINTFYICGSL